MRIYFLSLLFLITTGASAQTIINATPLYAAAGDYFTITVEMSGTPSNPDNIKLTSGSTNLFPWSYNNTTGNTYTVSYILRDYEKMGFYALSYNGNVYPFPIRIDRAMTPEKFEYQSVTSLDMTVSWQVLEGITYMQTDGLGNLYCVGNFTGSYTLNGQTITAAGMRDGFIAKFNSNGILIWIRKTGSSIDDSYFLEDLTSIGIHQDSVIYVTGYMRCDSSLKYDGTIPLIYPSRNVNSLDGFVMKLDSAGNYQWAAFQGSMRKDASHDVEIDDVGNAYVTGYAQSEDNFPNGPNDTSVTYIYNSGATDSIAMDAYATNQYGLFVARYSPTGQLVWAKRQSPDYVTPTYFPVRMKICSDNSLVILAKGAGELFWDGISCTNNSCCNDHYALLKLDSLGNRIWCLEDGNGVTFMDMGIDASDNIYVTTPTQWTFGQEATFLRKYDPSGTLLWSIPVQQNKVNQGYYTSVTDAAGNTYISHSYRHLWAGVGRVIVTKKFNNQGQLTAITYPEPASLYDENTPTAITLNATQDLVYLAGRFKGSQKFGDTTITSPTTLPFLLSMNNCPVSYDSLTVNSCGPYTTPGGNLITLSGYYGDTLVNAASCDSILLITLNVYSMPVVNITAMGPVTFCRGDSVVLSATPGIASYQWYNRLYAIPGATSMNYIAKSSGRYSCQSQSSPLCIDTSNIIVVHVPCIPIGPNNERSITTIENEMELFEISPNPGSGVFSIFSSGGQVQVFNSIGKLILSEDLSEGKSTIDISKFPNGIYFVTHKVGKTKQTQKLILLQQ